MRSSETVAPLVSQGNHQQACSELTVCLALGCIHIAMVCITLDKHSGNLALPIKHYYA